MTRSKDLRNKSDNRARRSSRKEISKWMKKINLERLPSLDIILKLVTKEGLRGIQLVKVREHHKKSALLTTRVLLSSVLPGNHLKEGH